MSSSKATAARVGPSSFADSQPDTGARVATAGLAIVAVVDVIDVAAAVAVALKLGAVGLD